MSFFLELIEQYGLLFVFGNVLIEQSGAPVPAYPTLVISGALLGAVNILARCFYSLPLSLP